MLEYLILNGQFAAAKHYDDGSHTSLREQVMNLFNKGNRIQFMELFNLLHKQSKLEFYLRVIHPSLRGKTTIPQPQKIAFKDYLDNRGSQLAKTTQFLQFYALPFIKNPLQHLAFKNLFKKQWVTNLKQKLQIYLDTQQRMLKNQIARVFSQYSNNNANINSNTNSNTNANITSANQLNSNQNKMLQDKVKQMQKINKKLFQQVKEFTQKYHMLQNNHKQVIEGYNMHMMESQSKWFQITKQLVGCSKQLIKMLIQENADCLNDRKFVKIKKKTQKYQRFVNKKFDDLVSHSEDISIFDRPSISDLSYTATHKNFHSHTQIINVQQYIPTDYIALKAFLKKASNQQKISIISGLFWRIVKSKTKQIRKLNIIGILHYDVLGIKSGQIQNMLASRQLMKHVVRLIQIISLDSNGKKIAFTTNLIKDLIGLVSQCHDPSCFQYLICTLGQISSEKMFKLKLIQHDIIEICVNILRSNKYSNNQIILENTVAIMLNMLEKPQGLKKYVKQRDIFEILKQCLLNNFKITRSLIYGIIFALLQNQQLFKLARLQKLPQFFNNIQSIDPNINKTQLKYLKSKLAKFQPKQKEENQEEDDNENDNQNEQQDEDYDIQEQYINELDEMMKLHDQFLKKFVLKGNQAVQQAKQVREVLQQYRQNRLPTFHSPKQQNISKLSSPKPNTDQKYLQTPYLKQKNYQTENSSKLPEVGKKVNNFINQQEVKPRQNNIKPKDRQNKLFNEKKQEQIQNTQRQRQRRMKKSVSADRGIGMNRNVENNKIYQSNKPNTNNKISQFKAMQERQRNYRSPPQKRPRQQVLRQLNQEIKAKQILKQQRQLENQRQNNSAFISDRNRRIDEYSQVFQSKPKLRRTPPRQ